jgi:L-threonylcarbamoyladenylate synthase
MVKRINIDNSEAIKSAITILNKGGIIAYPTDTLYGLGVDATNDKAIDKVNRLKGRSGPMSVMAANKNIALDWMDITTKQLEFIEPYLGGAQTLIVPVKDNIVSAKILSEKGTLGMRIPNNDFCNELSLKFGKPIVSTSVNRSGEAPMSDPNKIELEIGSEIDLLLDNGTLSESKGSTIYQLKGNNITVLRK